MSHSRTEKADNINTDETMKQSEWSYAGAFVRHRGLISVQEQDILRKSRVSIVGMGGVGGVDLITLARLGVGNFSIADPDCFDVSNTNRQYGAMKSTIGRSKVEVMSDIVRQINPEADIRTFHDPIGPDNAHDFLRDADVFVDGIDAFEIDIRRLLYGMAAKRGLYAIGAGPVGFSTVWVIFDPKGMSFDRYFNLSDSMDGVQKFASYIVGMAPKATQRRYIDMAEVDFKSRAAPSAGLACQLSSGVVAAEVLKMLLGRGKIYPAPYYHQFDAYLGKFFRKRLIGGNRHPVQRLKSWGLTKFLRNHMGNAGSPSS
jgi:molybdopterin/thiamine biosynthesis adenylyltransferase